MEKLEKTIKELIDVYKKTEEDIFEMVNTILIKSRKREMRKENKCRVKKRVVCRPVLLISDSSGEE